MSLLFVVGMPGSGKSRKGRELAEALSYHFVDLDEAIEHREHMTVGDFIRKNGMSLFRALEEEVLLELIEQTTSDCIISLGGGTVIIDGLIDKLKHHGKLIYLRADFNVLIARLIGNMNRPLFLDEQGQPLPESGLRMKLMELYDARKSYFNQSDIIVDVPISVGALKERVYAHR